MKKSVLQAAGLLLITGVALITYDGNAEKTAAIKDTTPPSKTYVMNDRKNLALSFNDSFSTVKSDTLTLWQTFILESQEKIDSNERRITELKTTMANNGGKMKDNYKKTINELERRNDGLRKRLGEYKNDEKENLQSFKQKFNKDINAVTKSLRDIKLK